MFTDEIWALLPDGIACVGDGTLKVTWRRESGYWLFKSLDRDLDRKSR